VQTFETCRRYFNYLQPLTPANPRSRVNSAGSRRGKTVLSRLGPRLKIPGCGGVLQTWPAVLIALGR
jgi:hypothetical protein